MTLTFRDTIRKISPPWLQNGVAEKLLYSLAVQVDAFGDALVAGAKLRFPGLYSDESLPRLGRERRIARGRIETETVYANRLRRWLTDHRTRGGPYALLAQLFAHYAPNNVEVALVYRSGRRFTMDVNGAITRDDIAFNPDITPSKWARWWLIFTWPAGLTVATWGSRPTWGLPDPPGHVWGVDGLIPQDVVDLRIVPHEWNAAHCFGRIILLSGGAHLWGYPPRLWGAGTWGAGAAVELDVA